MNYDLFIPAAAIHGSPGSAASAAQLFGSGGHATATAVARPPLGNQAPLRPPQGSASEQLFMQEVENTVVAFNDVFQQANISVQYRVDQDTDDIVITLINRDTDEVLRQMPPEQILKMRQRLEELMGLMFDSVA
jgi:flagellar protein FlaG